MSRQLTPRTTLDNLKKEAKRWLHAVRANDLEALTRLHRIYPDSPSDPSLRHIQHAVALEHGFTGWPELKSRLGDAGPAVDSNLDNLADTFLLHACADPLLANGRSGHSRRASTALRLLNRYPEIARHNLHTAVVCGDLSEVGRIVAERPEAAVERGGPLRERENPNLNSLWSPILNLCYGRLPIAAVEQNGPAIARILLDAGADPNDYFEVGSFPSRYTALCGIVGEGEDDALPHPAKVEIARLLLERGANPFDVQLFYNTHFHGEILWILNLIDEVGKITGRGFLKNDPDWTVLDEGAYGYGARYLLERAIERNKAEVVGWLLDHGANPNAAPAPGKNQSTRSLHEEAVYRCCPEIATLLITHGATPSAPPPPFSLEDFTAACLASDQNRAVAIGEQHPEYLQSHKPMFMAAERNNPEAVALLLDLGVSIEVENENKQRPLHAAAGANALKVAKLLIDRGAEIDPVEPNWSATPLGFAIYGQLTEMIKLISSHSHDVWELTFCGNVNRLRELVASGLDLTKVSTPTNTPLMWLPDDEKLAMQAAELLVYNGVDPSVKNGEGLTAADLARKRGLYAVADWLVTASTRKSKPTLNGYEEMAAALLEAYRTGTPEAMERHWRLTWHRRNWKAMRTYVQLDLGRPSHVDEDITLDDARLLVAREHGFGTWSDLVKYVGELGGQTGEIAAKPVSIFNPDRPEEGQFHTWGRSWDEMLSLMSERKVAGLRAFGQMTDDILKRVSKLDHITSLDLSGSKNLTDAGLIHLAQLPRLRRLNLSGTGITDAGLEVLRQLTDLRSIQLAWTAVTDAGISHLADREELEKVDLSGTQSGDGAIKSLAGKPHLAHFRSGDLVTDEGLPLFHDFPAFKTWQGGNTQIQLMAYETEVNNLLLRGRFTDNGMRALSGLDGLFALNLDDSNLAVTGAGLEHLGELPHLEWLAFDAKDESMQYIAALPRLRFLMCQDTAAGDIGFAALSRSQTLETIWGRRCHNLGSRGFEALSTMPALRALSVSCLNVEDSAISLLPQFPSLRELMPMDIPDEGYRHIGRCQNLERLILMYCRDTTDAATEHITCMPNLKKYFASYTQITDRTPELLSKIKSLEEVSFSSCAALTNEGVSTLSNLPNLQRVSVNGSPAVTEEIRPLFRTNVSVDIDSY